VATSSAPVPAPPAPERVLEARNVRKSFGAISVLKGVNLHLDRGEVLGLIGDNGAGKSTMIKILSGYHAPDAGEILIYGQPVHFRSPADSRAAGIETVYQDLGLVNDLSVYRNLFLRREPVRRYLGLLPILDDRRMEEESRAFLQAMRVSIPSVRSTVATLSGGQRQAIAVARSVYLKPRILILDEPLAAMGAKEGRMILDLIVELKRTQATSIILIAHNYAQVFDVCDRIAWLADGTIRLDVPVGQTSVEEMTRLVTEEYRLPS
jgi:simple sugar transport system ATP-binding protein